MYVCVCNMHACTYVYVHAHMALHMCICTCIYVCIHTHLFLCISVYTCVSMRAYTRTYLPPHTLVYLLEFCVKQCFAFLQVWKVSLAFRELKEIKETKVSLEPKVGEFVMLEGALWMTWGNKKAVVLTELGCLVLYMSKDSKITREQLTRIAC